MNLPRPTPLVAFIVPFTALVVLASCRDPLRVEPAGAQNAQIEATLTQLLAKVDSLQRLVVSQGDSLTGRLTAIDETLAELGIDVGVGVGVGASAAAYTQLEGSVCYSHTLAARTRLHSQVTLKATGGGTLGVDAYGNGATGQLAAVGVQSIGFMPEGRGSLQMQLCGKLTGQLGLDADAGASVTLTESSPLVQALMDVMANVNTSDLAGAASTRSMSGSNLSTGLNALANLSSGQMQFGSVGGGAAQLVQALPLPDDIRNLVLDPSTIFNQASSAASYATDQLCGQALRVGAFADVVDTGCDLRDQMPSPATVAQVFSSLDGLPTTLGALQGDLNTLQGSVGTLQVAMNNMCNSLGDVTQRQLTIPARTIEILGQSYTTFPGYSARLFPGMPRPSC